MKSIFSFLVILFSFSFILGCGETDNSAIDEAETYESFKSLFPLAENIPLSDYPEGWVKLTDEDVEELMNLEIPPNWFKMDIDPKSRAKYTHAQLLKQFGDIPQVRYIIEFGRNPGFDISHKMSVAYFEAHYHLFPNENNRRALEEAWNIPNQPIPEPPPPRIVRIEPITVERAEEIRIELIEKHGDIPHVHTVANFFIKVAQKRPITDNEFLTYLEAQHHLNPQSEYIRQRLEKYKRAKADGIPFHFVDDEDE